jgi:hydrogenase maturation protein HypF
LAGLRNRVSFEGQAAIEWEWLASDLVADGGYPYALTETGQSQSTDPDWIIDTRPLVRAVVRDLEAGVAAARIARRFHTTLVEMIDDVCARLRGQTGLRQVVLSGGVFMNGLLTTEAAARLECDGFEVYRHQLVPPNDGGLSLGQLAIAAAR